MLGWILFKNKDDNIWKGLEQNKTLIVAFVALSILLLLIDKEVKNIGPIGLTSAELEFFGGSSPILQQYLRSDCSDDRVVRHLHLGPSIGPDTHAHIAHK